MEYRILGPLEASECAVPVNLGGPKQRALLAMLLLHANQVVSTERLVEGLWDDPPARATKAVQVYISRLRKALGGTAPTSKQRGYLLQLAPEQFDLALFRRLREEARQDRTKAAEKLREALALWRGRALDEFTEEPFAQPERVRLDEEWLEAMEERIDAELALGHHTSLIGELESLVATQPLRERLRGQLMIALYRCGRQADALTVYQAGRRLLVDELGIEPSRPLQQLERAILNQDTSLEVAEEVPAESSSGVFVGRERELEQLSRGLDDAFAGRGGLFLLVGEPGIGKSWVADALLNRARRRGARVLVGRCWEAGGAPPYWPWVQSLRPYIHNTDPEALGEQLGPGAADLAQLFPELCGLLPDLALRSPPESEDARFRMFEATWSFVKAAASSRPIVVFLDDLHAADEPSLLLLQFFVRKLAEAPVLIIGAYRDVDPTVRDPLSTAVTELVRERPTTRVPLGGLAESEVAEYISRSCNRHVDQFVVARIHAQTEGNPLFVSELTQLLEGENGLEGQAVGSAPTQAGIPEGVREVIGRRLRTQSIESRKLLTAASVLGREFSLRALAGMSDLAEDALLDVLDEAVSARFVGEVPGVADRLRFEHALFRDTIYQDLTAPRRLNLHRQAGEALEVVYANRPREHLAELAHQFAAAAPVVGAGKAIGYARRAAEEAARLLAFEEAARLYRLALDLIDGEPDSELSQQCELLLALADVLARSGDTPQARDAFKSAAELATDIGASELLARAALGYGGRLLYARATSGDLLSHLLISAEEALGTTDSALRVRVLARHANAVSQDRPQTSDTLSEHALEIARRLEDPATLAYAISARLYATRAPTKLDERWELTGELIHAADNERAFEGHAYRTIIRFARGDASGVRADLDAMTRLSEELGQPSQRWWVAATSATLALFEGRFDDAEVLINRARTLGERAQNYDARNFFELQRFALRREQGRLAEILTELERTAQADPSRAILRCALAISYWTLGKYEEARDLLHQLASKNFSQLPVNNDWLQSAALLAELVAFTGDIDRAGALYQKLVPFENLNVDTEEVSTGAVSRYLGLLAATNQRYDLAARHFEHALAMNQRMGAHPWLARTQHDYARLCLARNESGDQKRASDLQRQAQATNRQLRMHPYPPSASMTEQTTTLQANNEVTRS